jgi:hypothetical protein
MYASTICKGINAYWSTILHLMDGSFYSPEPGGFNSVHFYNATEWEKANTEPSLQNRWFHPILALKEHKRIGGDLPMTCKGVFQTARRRSR